MHRLDSADREPAPIPTKVPRTSVGSPVEDLADESDDMEDNAISIGDIDVTWKSEVEKSLPMRLPDDLAYSIATIGSGLRNTHNFDMKSGISPPSDDMEERMGSEDETSMGSNPSSRSSAFSPSEQQSLLSSEFNPLCEARPSLGSRSDDLGSEETAKPMSEDNFAEFNASQAMENLSKRLSIGASYSAPASLAYRRYRSVDDRNQTLRSSIASSFSQVHAGERSVRSSYYSACGSNSVESESDSSSLGVRAGVDKGAPLNSSSDRSGTPYSRAQKDDREDQRFRHINGLSFLRTSRSLDRRLLFGFGGSLTRATDLSSLHSAPPNGPVNAPTGAKDMLLQQNPKPRDSKLSGPSGSTTRQSRISGLWGKFKDYIPAGSSNTSFS